MLYTAEMRMELMRCARDPVYFIESYVHIQHPMKGSVLFTLHPYQKQYINHLNEHRCSIAKMGRQQGKTMMTLAFMLWETVFKSWRTELIATQRFDMAKDLMERVRFMYERLPVYMRPALKYSNRQGMEFDNGSRLLAQVASNHTGRGMALSTAYLDEFAFWSADQQEAVLDNMLPCLCTGGSMIISSTLAEKDTRFTELYKLAVFGRNQFAPFSSSWSDHPGRDQQFKIDMMDRLGEKAFRLQFECEFPNG